VKIYKPKEYSSDSMVFNFSRIFCKMLLKG